MRLETEVKKIAKEVLKKALRQTSANGDMSSLKLLFPGSDDIPLRLAALLTDVIPSDQDAYASLIENAVADASQAFSESLDEWYQGKINIHEVLARYTYALFERSSDVALWAVRLRDGAVWEYPNPPLLASKYESVVGVSLRAKPSKSIQTITLLEEFLTDREKQMMRLNDFLGRKLRAEGGSA